MTDDRVADVVARLIRAAADATLLVDAGGTIRVSNAAAAALFGWPDGALVGRGVDELVPQALRPRHLERRVAFAGQARPRKMGPGLATHGMRRDGSAFAAEISLSPWDDGSVVVTVVDVTERTHAQQAVAASEARFRATFEQAAVGIAHVAPDGRFLRVNRKLCEIVGYERDELMRRTFQDITHAEDLGADLSQMRQLVAGGIEHYAMDKRYLRRDGEPVWARLTASMLRRADGTVDHFIAVVEDIDERRRSDDALRRLRAEMEQMLALHVATQTAAAIAHDLNQPLNAVASYNEAALRMLKAGNPRPERLEHALQSASEQAQRAGRVVRELMQFLQKGETTTEAVDLNAVVREALAIIQANGFGGFEAHVHLAPRLRPVQANRMQVEKVLVNLLRNSVEAMRGVGIATQQIRIDVLTADEEEMALVCVHDTGPGLDAAVAQRLFEPFFSTKARGIGMGLAVSRALVEAQGGRLWHEAGAGPGATFRFTLPFAR